MKIKAYGLCPYKIEDNQIKIVLCKSVTSREKWGLLKGVIESNESPKECAQREFFEESGIKISMSKFENYFEQHNYYKDIGIWLVNIQNIHHFDDFFINDSLKPDFLSWENSEVKYFDIMSLPPIKKKQNELIEEIISFLQSKNQSHQQYL